MGTVSSSAHLWGLVAVSKGKLNLLQFKTLGLRKEILDEIISIAQNIGTYFSIGGNVGKEVKEGLGGLLWPSNLVTASLVLLASSVSANSTSVLGERDGSLVKQYILKVSLGLVDGQALDSIADFSAVLVVDTKVTALGLSDWKV